MSSPLAIPTPSALAAMPDPKPTPWQELKASGRAWVSYAMLSLLRVVAVGPFLWLLSTALKSPSENIFSDPPQLLPAHPTLMNMVEAWTSVDMANYFINSIVVTGLSVLFNLFFSVLAAYPLARFSFKGKQTLFLLILATMMIPFQVIMIPLFMIVLKLRWVDSTGGAIGSYLGQVVPFAVSGFGIFFMRQALAQVPKQLEESAVLDGCNAWQVLTQVLLPLIRPSLATLAIFTSLATWGEFLWPSIVIASPKLYTLPVGLVNLQGAFSTNWRLIAAGTILATLPILVFFLVLQRYFIQGSLAGAVKG